MSPRIKVNISGPKGQLERARDEEERILKIIARMCGQNIDHTTIEFRPPTREGRNLLKEIPGENLVFELLPQTLAVRRQVPEVTEVSSGLKKAAALWFLKGDRFVVVIPGEKKPVHQNEVTKVRLW